ncbi:MAG: hypothetical protein WBP26_05025 [Candidatus Saccharimonadales bacterium]
MSKNNFQVVLQKKMTRKQFILTCLLIIASLVGITALLRQLKLVAATESTAALEAESGTLANGTIKVPDREASGKGAVWFGKATTFVAFAPGTVRPLGFADEAAGLGKRNVGPRIPNLRRHDGDYVLTPGATVFGLEIFGRLIGRGDASTIVSDCIIHGATTPATSDSAAAVGTGTSYDFGGITIEWSRIDVTNNRGFTDPIAGGGYTLRYSEVRGGVDGIGANRTGNTTVECCRIWDGYYFSWWNDAVNSRRTTAYTDTDGVVFNPPFPNQSTGDTHSDGIQLQQFGGWVFRGNYIGGNRIPASSPSKLDPTIKAENDLIKQFNAGREFVYSAIMITPVGYDRVTERINPTGALIEKNWLHGGAARLNIGWNADDTLSGVTIRDNRFIRSSYGFYIYKHKNSQAVLSNNIYDDTGAAVPTVLW